MKKITIVLVIMAIMVIPVFAGGQQEAADNGQNELAEEQIFRYATDDRSVSSLDPVCKGNHGTYPIQNMVFESLIRYEPGCTDIEGFQPGLAESWTVSEDGKNWTFNLRKGVQWHKGYGEFTSSDVEFSVQRALNSEKSKWKSRFANVESIDTSDPYKVVFYLKTMDAFFLLKVANKDAGWISCKAAVEEMGESEYGLLPIGTGPFEITENVAKEIIKLKKNSEYWRGAPILDRIEYYLMPDNTSRTMALLNGEVDGIRGTVSQEWYDMVTSKGMKIGYGLPGQLILNFNMTIKPLTISECERHLPMR